MNTFKRNMINIFGKQGEQWFANLPSIINELTAEWKLSQIVPVDNMTFNYVAKANTHLNQQVILKISCDQKSIANEMQALKYFDGSGSIQLIAYNQKHCALLLQQAVPGMTLKSLYFSQMEYVMECYIGTMKKLHGKNLSNKYTYPHIADWLKALDKLSSKNIPAQILDRAIELRNRLLASMIGAMLNLIPTAQLYHLVFILRNISLITFLHSNIFCIRVNLGFFNLGNIYEEVLEIIFCFSNNLCFA